MSDLMLDPVAAAATLRQGGVIAYPTEAVWGLGCDPFNPTAVRRLLKIKRRPVAKGMIVIAATPEQARPWLDWASLPKTRQNEILASWPGPNTWLIPCAPQVPGDLRGDHDTLAVRVTAHPVAAAICRAFDGLVVSTSANLAGAPPAREFGQLSHELVQQLDGWVDGPTLGRSQPSIIRDARSGEVVRPG